MRATYISLGAGFIILAAGAFITIRARLIIISLRWGRVLVCSAGTASILSLGSVIRAFTSTLTRSISIATRFAISGLCE
jgi:hypothetical protein